MPQPLYSFLEEYDFGAKTIIPFNVHNGSRFSSTINTIQELEPNAQVISDGFTVSEQKEQKYLPWKIYDEPQHWNRACSFHFALYAWLCSQRRNSFKTRIF